MYRAAAEGKRKHIWGHCKSITLGEVEAFVIGREIMKHRQVAVVVVEGMRRGARGGRRCGEREKEEREASKE